jgi:hypothetical protein
MHQVTHLYLLQAGQLKTPIGGIQTGREGGLMPNRHKRPSMRRSKKSRPTWRPFESGRRHLSGSGDGSALLLMVVVQSKVFSFSLRPGQWGLFGPARTARSRARVLQRVHRSEAQTLDGGCLQAPKSRSSGRRETCHLHSSAFSHSQGCMGATHIARLLSAL